MSAPYPTGEAHGWGYRVLVAAFVVLFTAILLAPFLLVLLLSR